MSNITLFKINQFKNIDSILTEIEKVGGTVLSPTVSLCHHCHYHIPAYRYALNNKVYICKKCQVHGFSHNLIESDYEFYKSLKYSKTSNFNFNDQILIEASDRCNLECPHCYHLPDNKITDVPLEQIVDRIKTWPESAKTIVFAGAEATLRKDFADMVFTLDSLENIRHLSVLTNGVRFADEDFTKSLIGSTLIVSIGLNHPNYINNATIRSKQERGIENCGKYLKIGYIGYTMVDLSELDYILNEITTKDWKASHYRIRAGSEIGRNASDGQFVLSDLYKEIEKWAVQNSKTFERVQADDNIYHVVASLDGKLIRIIQWCDETNIDMEELRTGPWCDFVDDGVTNFLHQIIRRDVWKNQSLPLPDTPPLRYTYQGQDLPPLDDTFTLGR